MPDVSVIIPARDVAATLPATLDGLARQRFAGDLEVILVDDGSTDGTAAIARTAHTVTVVIAGTGAGPASARNAGAAVARSPLLAFIDADCRPTEEWLASGVAALHSADLVLGETRPDPREPLGPYDRTLWVSGSSPLFESANLFVRTDLFRALGGFESWLGPRDGKELGEDVWFGWRARRGGARIDTCPDALAHHAILSRGPSGYIAERWRRRYFPTLVRRVPELRRELFVLRLFLSRRSAAFDGAATALALGVARRNPVALLVAAPYAAMLCGDLLEGRRRGLGKLGAARLAATRIAADSVGAAALAYGSVRARTPVL
jgi:glycosyltransferase involved in cell wall biosynthesis